MPGMHSVGWESGVTKRMAKGMWRPYGPRKDHPPLVEGPVASACVGLERWEWGRVSVTN